MVDFNYEQVNCLLRDALNALSIDHTDIEKSRIELMRIQVYLLRHRKETH